MFLEDKLNKLKTVLEELSKSLKEKFKQTNKKEKLEKEEDYFEMIKTHSNGQWEIVKSRRPFDSGIKPDWTKHGHKSVFNMDHVNQVASMKDHDEAKNHATKIVDDSDAKEETKNKIKFAISRTNSIKDLASLMSNHILAHSGLNVIGAKKPNK